MYFWRIEKLKDQMAERALSEREVLPYLAVFVCLIAVTSYTAQTVLNLWDGLHAVWTVAFAVFGTLYVYHQNEGNNGKHFLQRFLAISWVVSIRLVVAIIPIAFIFLFFLSVTDSHSEETTWYEALLYAIIDPIFFWRTGYHVRDLAQRNEIGQESELA